MSTRANGRPVRILTSGGLATGGVQTHLVNLCKILRSAGAEVTVAAVWNAWPETQLSELRDLGVRVLSSRLAANNPLGKLKALATWPLRLKNEYDVLYCIGRGRMHVWMRRFLRPGGLAIYHEIVDSIEGPGARMSEVLPHMDCLIANSAVVANGLISQYGRLPIRTIPFLTSDSELSPPANRPPVGSRVLRVAYLGRVVAHKRPDWLIEHWAELARVAPVAPARLDIYGPDDGDGLVERLRDRARVLKLDGVVLLHGAFASRDLPGILGRSDLVVLPSGWEGLPLVLVESMLCGVPFVATDAGGTAELANPDVEIGPSDLSQFESGLTRIAGRLRQGDVDSGRLFDWANERYGFEAVSSAWRKALMAADVYFDRAARHS